MWYSYVWQHLCECVCRYILKHIIKYKHSTYIWQIITELVSTRQNLAKLGTKDKLQNERLILAKFQFKPEDAQERGTLVLSTKLKMAPQSVKGQFHIKYMHIEGIQRPINIICTSSHNFYTCP